MGAVEDCGLDIERVSMRKKDIPCQSRINNYAKKRQRIGKDSDFHHLGINAFTFSDILPSHAINFNNQIQTGFHKLVSSEINMISSLFILCPGAEKAQSLMLMWFLPYRRCSRQL